MQAARSDARGIASPLVPCGGNGKRYFSQVEMKLSEAQRSEETFYAFTIRDNVTDLSARK